MEFKQSISNEHLKTQKFELYMAEQEGNYSFTACELSQCKRQLMNEQSRNEVLNLEILHLKVRT